MRITSLTDIEVDVTIQRLVVDHRLQRILPKYEELKVKQFKLTDIFKFATL